MDHHKKNIRILLLLFVGVLMSALDISIVGPAIPAIEKSMQIHGGDLSWIFSIYVLFYLFGIPVMTKLSDIHGRRLIYIASVSIFGIGSGLVSISHDITLLLIGRAIQGFGASGIFPIATATIGDVFPIEKRGRALGILGAVFGISFILGPLIAGSLLLYFNWSALFLINLPVAAILIIFAFRLLPGKTPGEKPLIDWAGIIMLVIVLSCFTLGLNNIDVGNVAASLGSWSVLPFLLTVMLLTPLLIIYERTQENSILNIKLFKSPQIRLVGVISFGLGLFQSSVVFLPKLAVELFNVEPSKASFMLLPLVISTAIIPPVSGRLLDKVGSRVIVFSGLIIAVVALILFSMLSKDITLFYIAEVGLGFGLAIRASLKYIVLNESEVKDRAATLGMLIIFISVGQLTGAALIGVIAAGSPNGPSGFGYAFLVLTALTSFLVLLSIFLKRRKDEIPEVNG
ncbi:MAG: MFS transporter [Bacteroidota bacterium]